MSERMTETRWEHLNASETVWTKREQAEVAGEVNALQIDVMEKDATIAALADALESTHSQQTGCWCRATDGHSAKCAPRRAALRLAGRL